MELFYLMPHEFSIWKFRSRNFGARSVILQAMSGEHPASPPVLVVETPVDPNGVLEALKPATEPAKVTPNVSTQSRITELEAANAMLQKGACLK